MLARNGRLVDRRLIGGRMPPCPARRSRTELGCRSNRDAIRCRDLPSCQRSRLRAFRPSVPWILFLRLICNTPAACAAFSASHRSFESAAV